MSVIQTDILLYDDGKEFDSGGMRKKVVLLKKLTKEEAVNAFKNGKRVYFIYKNNDKYRTNCRKVCKDLDYLNDHYDYYHEVCGILMKGRSYYVKA